MNKAKYVLAARQTRRHSCHWPHCDREVPPARWGCREHWFMLPKNIRDKIWRAYRPGQEIDLRPSEAYLAAAEAAQVWIRKHEQGRTTLHFIGGQPTGV